MGGDARAYMDDMQWPSERLDKDRASEIARAEIHRGLFERADDLLWSGELTEAQRRIWELFCGECPGEKVMAKRLGMTYRALCKVLYPLKARCGFKVGAAYRTERKKQR